MGDATEKGHAKATSVGLLAGSPEGGLQSSCWFDTMRGSPIALAARQETSGEGWERDAGLQGYFLGSLDSVCYPAGMVSEARVEMFLP